jgi:hypothetical protein
MTRINAGIPAKELHDKHLLAEHREIKRIPNQISSGRYNMKGQPTEFCLGTGHVKFFYDKCGYLLKRYIELRTECRRRGFQVQDWEEAWTKVPPEMMGDWTPTETAVLLISKRIEERLQKMNS